MNPSIVTVSLGTHKLIDPGSRDVPKSLKLIAFLLLAVALTLLVCGCKGAGDTQNVVADTSDSEEAVMDPSIEHDAQMIIDTLSLPEYYEDNAVKSVKTLRGFGVESISSIRIIDDADQTDYERAGHYTFVVEIIDDSGTCYHVGFNNSGLAIAFYPPDGLGTGIVYNQEIH